MTNTQHIYCNGVVFFTFFFCYFCVVSLFLLIFVVICENDLRCDATKPTDYDSLHSETTMTTKCWHSSCPLILLLPLLYILASIRFWFFYVLCFSFASVPSLPFTSRSLHYTLDVDVGVGLSSSALTQNNKINWNEIIRSLSETTTGWTEINSIYEEEEGGAGFRW